MLGGRHVPIALATLVLGFGSIDCGKETGSGPACESPLTVVKEPVTKELLALPIVAALQDTKSTKGAGFGCGEHSEADYEGKLGPLATRYKAWDYKGQKITSNASLLLSSPTCRSAEVAFTMATASVVRLRHDPTRDLYIVTNSARPIGPSEPPYEGEQRDALIVRMTPPKH